MGSIWVLRGKTLPLFNHNIKKKKKKKKKKKSKFPDINANNNDNNKIKIMFVHYKMKVSIKLISTIFPAWTLIHGHIFMLTRMSPLPLKLIGI